MVSEKKAQILEDLATKSLKEPQVPVAKLMANFCKAINLATGASETPTTPAKRARTTKEELTSPIPKEEFKEEYVGIFPEGKYMSRTHKAQQHIVIVPYRCCKRHSSAAELCQETSHHQEAFYDLSSMVSNSAWSAKVWIQKRMTMREGAKPWLNQALVQRVIESAQPFTDERNDEWA